MRRLAATGAFLAVALLGPVSAAAPHASPVRISDVPAGAYVSDPAHTMVTAKVRELGLFASTVRFNKVEARLRFDPVSPGASHVAVSIDPASINSGSRQFDRQLSGEGWFEAEKFPKITFVSDRLDVGDGVHGTLAGTLTLRGVTRPVILSVTLKGADRNLPSAARMGFSASTRIRRSDFGMIRLPGLIGDEVELTVDAEFARKMTGAS